MRRMIVNVVRLVWRWMWLAQLRLKNGSRGKLLASSKMQKCACHCNTNCAFRGRYVPGVTISCRTIVHSSAQDFCIPSLATVRVA